MATLRAIVALALVVLMFTNLGMWAGMHWAYNFSAWFAKTSGLNTLGGWWPALQIFVLPITLVVLLGYLSRHAGRPT